MEYKNQGICVRYLSDYVASRHAFYFFAVYLFRQPIALLIFFAYAVAHDQGKKGFFLSGSLAL